MPTCPKCGFALAGGETECPACGVILAKVRAMPQTPPPMPASPYAPPAAATRDPEPVLPAAPQPTGGEISPQTIQALTTLRPWLRFLVGYGFVVLTLMAIGAVSALLVAGRNPKAFPLALIYGFYSIIGFAFLLPLRRSVEAIRRLPERGPRAAVEGFIVEQGTFWRRTGILTAVMVILLVLGLLLAIVLGGAAIMKQISGS